MAEAELYVWPGAWGVPSLDPECLKVIAYARFAKKALTVRHATNPQMSPSGTFPFYRHGDVLLGGANNIIAHWRKAGLNIDADLSSIQGAETVAYIGLLAASVDLARAHALWAVEDNYREFTRGWYAQIAPFPVGAILTYQARREATARIAAAGFDLEDPQPLYDKVSEALNTLSVRLGDGPFFFGRAPTTLDAAVFALLAPVLRSDVPDDRLRRLVRNHAPLVRHFDTIARVYFDGGFGPLSEGTPRAPVASPEQRSFRRQKWLAVGVSVVAMIGYAFLSGIVSVVEVDEDGEAIEEEEGAGEYEGDDGAADDDDGADDDDDDAYYYDE